MTDLKPLLSSYIIKDLNHCTKITIPAQKHRLGIAIISVWVVLWVVSLPWSGNIIFSLINVLLGKFPDIPENSRSLINGATLLILFLCSSWVIIGFAALSRLLWVSTGNEIIEINNNAIIICNQVIGIGFNKRYNMSHIRNLRVSPFAPYPFKISKLDASIFGLTNNQIAFDYGGKIIRFGKNINDKEANQIVSAMKAKFPNYGQ